MVGLIDTHCHLYLEEYDDDRQKLVDEARASGIDTLLMPNVDLETVDRLFSLCDECPDFVYPMMGLHPTSVGPDYVEALGKRNLLWDLLLDTLEPNVLEVRHAE